MQVERLGEAIEAIDGVHLAQLAAGERMSVQHFRIEPGATVHVHDHPHEQAGFLFEGELTWLLEDNRELVTPAGSSYVLAGDEPHGCENRGEVVAVGVELFSPPRENPPWEQ